MAGTLTTEDLEAMWDRYQAVRVIDSVDGYDPHNFDGDRDGVGCESN